MQLYNHLCNLLLVGYFSISFFLSSLFLIWYSELRSNPSFLSLISHLFKILLRCCLCRQVLWNHLCTRFLRNCKRKTIFFGSNKWNLWSRVIIFNAFLLSRLFRRNMLLSKIVILTKLPMCIMLGRNRTNFFLLGFSPPSSATCLLVWMVASLCGSYEIAFNHIFSRSLELVFDSF